MAIGITLMQSCYYDVEEELYPDLGTCNTEALTYENGIKPLIDNNCATSGCHLPGQQPPALSTFQEVSGSISRLNVRAVEDKTMPPSGPLSNCSIDQLRVWIAAGAPEN